MRAYQSPRLPASAGRGVVGVLLLAVLLVGVVAMHAMGGSSTHHGGPAAVVGQAAPAPAVHAAVDDAPGDAAGDAGRGSTTDDVGHEAVTAMCLMVLVGILALVAPGRAVLVALRPGRRLTGLAGPPVRGATPPDLHALGISRT